MTMLWNPEALNQTGPASTHCNPAPNSVGPKPATFSPATFSPATAGPVTSASAVQSLVTIFPVAPAALGPTASSRAASSPPPPMPAPEPSPVERAAERGLVEQALINLLDRGVTGRPAEHQAELHARLARAADERDLIDVAYRTIETELGPLLLASTSVGLVRVAYAVEGHDQVLTDLAERIGPRVLQAPGRLDQAAHQIDEYLHRDRRRFDLSLDLRLASGFRHAVLAHLQAIDYGSTASYAAVAAAAGSPRAVRAVGTACARNPLPVVVPCHRVVRSDGTPGQYVGGLDAKRTLLAMESTSAAGAMG